MILLPHLPSPHLPSPHLPSLLVVYNPPSSEGLDLALALLALRLRAESLAS